MNTNYSDFGFPNLLDIQPDAIQRNSVREIVELHKAALVSFVVKKEHHSHHVRVLGSGFFTYSEDPTEALIVTAKHVLEDFEKLGFGWITIGSRMIPIGNTGIRVLDPHRDIAIWHIPSNHVLQYIPPLIASLPLMSSRALEEQFYPTCSFALFGYPGSKNRSMDMRESGKRERALFGLALHGYAFDVATRELCFHYQGKGTPETWADRIKNPPELAGMSGSPCVRFVVHKDLKRLAVVVAGVFTRKHGPHEIRAVALGDAWLDRNPEQAPR